jgi:hypothetical protein
MLQVRSFTSQVTGPIGSSVLVTVKIRYTYNIWLYSSNVVYRQFIQNWPRWCHVRCSGSIYGPAFQLVVPAQPVANAVRRTYSDLPVPGTKKHERYNHYTLTFSNNANCVAFANGCPSRVKQALSDYRKLIREHTIII